MATIISTKTSGVGGLEVTGDASGVLQLASNNGTTAVTVDASQNVGIGTASPTTKLSITTSASEISNFNSTNASGSFSSISNAGINYGFIGDASQLIGGAPLSSLGIRSQNNLIFSSGGFAERMRIDSSGLVGIGTNSPSNSGGVLNIVYNSSNPITIKNTGVTSNAGQWAISLGAADNFIVQNNNGAGVQLTFGASAWSGYSDERLKTVTGTYTDALAGVSKLQPVKFTWKADESNKPQVGILAQSIQDVVPEAIDSVTMTPEDTTEYLTVRYTELIPLLTAAIQELKAELDTVKAELAELKGAA